MSSSSPPRRPPSSREGGRRLFEDEEGAEALAGFARLLPKVSSREETALCLSGYLATLPGLRSAWFGFPADGSRRAEGFLIESGKGLQRMGRPPAEFEPAGGAEGGVGERLQQELRIATQGEGEALLLLAFDSLNEERPYPSASHLSLLQALLELALQRLERLNLAELGQVQWEKVFDASSDLFVFHAPEGGVFRVNLALSAFLGRPLASCIGARCEDLLPGLCTGHEAEDRSWTDPASGRIFQVSTQIVNIGRGTAVLHVLHEITEQIRLQELALERDRMAFSSMLLKGVAHEIRNPLFALSTATRALERKVGADGRLSDHVGHILQQVRRMDSLVRRFLSISFAPLASEASPQTAREVVDRALDSVSERCPPGSRERVAVSLEDDRLVLPGSEGALSGALFDLLENALHFSAPGGRVELKVRRSGRRVTLLVRDGGPGLSPEARANLFVPFFTTRIGRTGLGLASAKATVLRLGGEIEVLDEESFPGAAFLVSFPVADEP
jgi:signal transduction histidine kinase